MADKFFSAFNGRYFRDDQIDFSGIGGGGFETMAYQNEIMHTVFLNDLVAVNAIMDFNINYEY